MMPTKPFFDHSEGGPQYSSAASTAYTPQGFGSDGLPATADGVGQPLSSDAGVIGDAPTGTLHAQKSSGYRGIHPIAAFFHLLFKVGALIVFLFGGFGPFVLMFVLCILLLAADFWVTKNITGRLLVSMRWWNKNNDDGTTEWIFESAPEDSKDVNQYDLYFFWFTTVGFAAAWVLMMVFSILNLTWLPVTVVGFLLNGANVLGYFKCSRDAKRQVARFMLNQAAQRPDIVQGAATAVYSASK